MTDKTAKERAQFLSKVKKSVSCWQWLGTTTSNGYGRLGKQSAHRLSHELFKGPIPKGLHIDHLCRNPGCVNPKHLEAVTQRENTLRGFSPAALHAQKTHCPKGHPFAGANLAKRTRRRDCLKCHAESGRRRYMRMTARTHKAIPPYNESTICGTGLWTKHIKTANRWGSVTCRHCLDRKEP